MYGDRWTSGKVLDELTEAFRAMKGRSLYSPTLNTFEAASDDSGVGLIAATARYLGRESMARQRLLRVTRIAAYVDESLVRVCAESGVARRSLYRYASRVAAAINHDRRLEIERSDGLIMPMRGRQLRRPYPRSRY